MHCPSTPVLGTAAAIMAVLFMGCSSGSGVARDAGLSAGATTATSAGATTVGDALPVAGGGTTRTGGEAGTALSVSAGGNTGSNAGSISTSVSGGTPAGGSGGSVNTGGGRTAASSSATAVVGGSGVGGTTILGGTATTGKTSTATGGTTNPQGGTVAGGTSAGGTTTMGGSRSGPILPARFVGNIDVRANVPTDFSKYWDQLTPENAGKWQSVQAGSRSTFNWKALDTLYGYAEEHNLIFKEMCFIWGSASANWLNNDNAMEAAKAWMTAFCDRYPKTRLIDVVNEPTHAIPLFAQGLGGGTRTTWDWVANSFKMAREACPNAVLILNDYNICEYASDHSTFLNLVKAIKALDAPVDAIGCEAHDAAKVSVSTFKDYLDDLASQTGLPIYITEFDIGLADDEKQRVQYADYFTMFWDNPNVKGATLWGYVTGATWRDNTGIMSSAGTMRPAMSWLMDFLKR